MSKKLHISLIFSNLVVFKNIKSKPSYVQPLYKIIKILEICKKFLKISSMTGNVLIIVVLFPSFRFGKWWRYP